MFVILVTLRFRFPTHTLTTLSSHGCTLLVLLHSSSVSVFVFVFVSSLKSPHPKCPVQSAHHWKSQCRENCDFAESLRYNRQSGCLQVWPIGESPSGMCSFSVVLSISRSIQFILEPTIEVGCAYFCRQKVIMMILSTA